ncbi:DUF6338 family protein [Xanthomonas campestris pv. raphani]|uniref:DUF6338 family protein n=1 Tax=Xanthomonas campestris TaxID=339 RepID=UPI002B238B94|nr:DUF6338 family protein [Xanthomonas campestris]MEA9898429.1 DUF6338 family protein [Xanthomonas campestris pv. raphani]
MDELSTEVVKLLTYLLPGFTAAWIFFGLTSHPKPSQFERVVQALILTFVIQTLLGLSQWVALLAGRAVVLGPWSLTSSLVASFALAIAVGLALSFYTNKDWLHSKLRKHGFTSRTSHPSEWYCVFAERADYVIVQLKDGRRLYGWPKEWPITPGQGQLYIQVPSWIGESGEAIDLPQLDGILIDSKDVQWVEFMRNEETTDEQ